MNAQVTTQTQPEVKVETSGLEKLHNALAPQQNPQLPAGISGASDSIMGLVNEEVANKLYRVLQGEASRSEGLTERLVWMIRTCGQVKTENGDLEWLPYERALAIAEGTVRAAEIKFCREMKIKSASSYVNDFGVKPLASYVAIKSTLFGAVHDREELITQQQLLWNFEHEKEGKEAKFTHKDFLNIWTNHYQDLEKSKGSTRFMGDIRQAQKAAKELESKVRLAARAAETALKEAAAKSQQTGTPAISGPSAGLATSGKDEKSTQLPAPVLQAMNFFVRQVHEAVGILTDAEIAGYLQRSADRLRIEIDNKREADRVAASEAGKRPVAEAIAELPEVETELVKPEWITDEDWAMHNDEERVIMMEDKEAYLEEKAKDEQNIKDFAPDQEEHGPENIIQQGNV